MIVKTDIETLKEYARDASNTTGICSSVCFPSSSSEISELFLKATESNTPVTVCGNRTGLTGGGVPQGGILVNTERMKGIVSFNAAENLVTVLPGTSLQELHTFAEQNGSFFPPDPTEQLASCGGLVATNASGARTFLYGSVRNFVYSLQVVLPTGKILSLTRGNIVAHNYTFSTGDEFIDSIPVPRYTMPPVKNAAGIFSLPNVDLIDLFIGSEGIAGVFTSITFRLLPLPYSVLSAVAHFPSEESGLNFIELARGLKEKAGAGNPDGVRFRALEFFERNALQFLKEDFAFVKEESAAAVWFELESQSPEGEARDMELLEQLLVQTGSLPDELITAQSPAALIHIKKFRHAVSYKVNEYITRNNFRKLGTDLAVPHTQFREFYRFCISLAQQNAIPFVAYGHFGNSHLHLNMLPRTPEEFTRGKEVYEQLCNRALFLGGTYSAEHGTGKNKKVYLLKMYGHDAVEQMRKLKKYLDPSLLLNPGTMF